MMKVTREPLVTERSSILRELGEAKLDSGDHATHIFDVAERRAGKRFAWEDSPPGVHVVQSIGYSEFHQAGIAKIATIAPGEHPRLDAIDAEILTLEAMIRRSLEGLLR